jgi:16S rRNA (guanine966-N2)-methyltransferase
MKIIAGEFKDRRLETPENYDIRPTSSRIRESIFNLLMYEIEDSYFVDLFAGTGGVGLEALSRGAGKCLFCDSDRASAAIIKRNVAACRAEDRSRIVSGDFMKALRSVREKVDIFFIDPPYATDLCARALEAIDSLDLLASNGIIIAEHDRRDSLPERVGGLVLYRDKKYGRVVLSFYVREDSAYVRGEE